MINAHDYAWLATRTKALLTAAEKSTLATMRGGYKDDPHVVAAIDLLLAP